MPKMFHINKKIQSKLKFLNNPQKTLKSYVQVNCKAIENAKNILHLHTKTQNAIKNKNKTKQNSKQVNSHASM